MSSPDTEFISIVGRSSGKSPTVSPKTGARSLPDDLPVLGLSDIVIFPTIVAPLLVETEQSIQLIDDVVAGDRFLCLVLQKDPDVDSPMPQDLYSHGCAARVIKMLKFPDRTVRVLVEGLGRVKILKYPNLRPYLKARIKLIDEQVEESIETSALARNAQQQFQEVIRMSPALSDQIKVAALNTEEPAKLSDLIASNINLTLEERQELLAQPSAKKRLSALIPMLRRELEVLNLGNKIQNEVTTSMSKTQREFYLREQLRVIQKELGESDPSTSEIVQLRELVEGNSLPEEVSRVAMRELDRLQYIPPSAAEYTVSRNYIDWLANLPWNRTTEDKIDLTAAKAILDAHHFGLEKVKERLLEFLAVLKIRQEQRGPILCLAGPPGIGKTSLGRSVAEAMGREFVRISLGGMRDEAEIRGHRRTYVGAMPGRILQSLRRVESANPVVLLDEVDKIGSDFRGDPASALLEVLDPQQNRTFSDHFLEVPFDLSRVLFIATANTLDPIHPALRDRLEIIEIPSYTPMEKFEIAKRHLIPRQLEEHGLKKGQVAIQSGAIRKLVSSYTREAGVRQLEREIGALVRKSTRKLVDASRKVKKVTVAEPDLDDMLGPARYYSETAEKNRECGIVVGLAWTQVGGDILFIEATRMAGKGQLILTGSLGDVMKESAQTALSYLRSQSTSLGIDVSDLDKWDIHVHVPAGATPKDGPSAGVTIFTALASMLTRKVVPSNLAMTGEISLRGRVLPVGGIKEKLLAACRSGIKTVVIPAENEKDLVDVPDEVRRKLNIHPVRMVSDLIPVVFGK